MYGLPLSQSDQRIRSVFQSVYNNCTYVFFFNTGLKTEGIYRLTGTISNVKSLKVLFNQGKIIIMCIFTRIYLTADKINVTVCCSV